MLLPVYERCTALARRHLYKDQAPASQALQFLLKGFTTVRDFSEIIKMGMPSNMLSYRPLKYDNPNPEPDDISALVWIR